MGYALGEYIWQDTSFLTDTMLQSDGAWACDDDVASIGFPWDLHEQDLSGSSSYAFAVTVIDTNSYDIAGTGTGTVEVGTTPGGNDLVDEVAAGDYTHSFTASGTTAYVTVTASTWDLVTVQETPTGAEILPDFSPAGNDLQVVGQITRTPGLNGISAIVVDDKNYVQGTVDTPGQLQGRELAADGTWIDAKDASQFTDADDTGGNLVIKGDVGGTTIQQLRWNQ